MARQRFIWPNLWDDPALGRLKPEARLLYIGCFSLADDQGRLLGDPASLKAKVFPYDSRLSATRTRQLRDAVLAASNSLLLYEDGGVEFLWFKNWTKYQKPKYPKPSTYPPHPDDPDPELSPKPSPKPRNDSGNDSGNVSEIFREASPETPPWVGLGRDGLGRDEKDSGRPLEVQDAATVRELIARDLGGAA